MEIKEFAFRYQNPCCPDGRDCPNWYECQEPEDGEAQDYCPLTNMTTDFVPVDKVIK